MTIRFQALLRLDVRVLAAHTVPGVAFGVRYVPRMQCTVLFSILRRILFDEECNQITICAQHMSIHSPLSTFRVDLRNTHMILIDRFIE